MISSGLVKITWQAPAEPLAKLSALIGVLHWGRREVHIHCRCCRLQLCVGIQCLQTIGKTASPHGLVLLVLIGSEWRLRRHIQLMRAPTWLMSVAAPYRPAHSPSFAIASGRNRPSVPNGYPSLEYLLCKTSVAVTTQRSRTHLA
jgi:hypothetical protein